LWIKPYGRQRMTRQEAIEQFKKENVEILINGKQDFLNHLQEQTEVLVKTLKKVFSSLNKEWEEQRKGKLMFLYFSLLRIDLLSRRYQIMIQAMDARWYMDTEPLQMTFSLEYLFEILNPVWDRLNDNRVKYIDKVNAYDVSHMMQELLMECNGILAQQLRFMFRDIEDNNDFAAIPKEDAWHLYWGEYRDKCEMIACVDRSIKDQQMYDRSVRKTEQSENELAGSYWYGMEASGTDCSGKMMYFINFEDCTLSNISFDNSNMTGARFRNCTLKGCSFQGTILRQADFSDCTWEDNMFTGADLMNAVFMEQEIPFVHLDGEQIQMILIDRRQEET